ncbi:MAG: hypothetical protein LUQ31_08885 [Methanoregula sp.]|nr:hypothetical protein [Methanoregula sp.]
MHPKITGVCLYPLEYAVFPWGFISSGIDETTVQCSTRCEVQYAAPIKHNFVCESGKEGDFKHVRVSGMIQGKTKNSLEPYYLMSLSLDKNQRAWWAWPNKQDYRQINAEYEIKLKLIKTSADQGPTIEWTDEQDPFIVKLLPPPPPIKPGK